MSISSQRTISELKREVYRRGISLNNDKKITKTDYILAIRDSVLKERYNDKIPKDLELILSLESPMLCQRLTVLNPDYQEDIWKSDEWIAEEKMDGVRLLMIHIDGKTRFYTRNISVSDFLPIEYHKNIYLGNVDLSQIKTDFIIDMEVISNNSNIDTMVGNRGVICLTQLQSITALLSLNYEESIKIQKSFDTPPIEFKSFDCLYYNGEWITEKPLYQRVEYLIPIVKNLQEKGVQISRPISTYQNKKAFYNCIVQNGGEGIVLKNVNTKYISNNTRNKNGWVKVKRSMTESLSNEGLSDTIDAFVSGYERSDENKSLSDYVGTLIFSVYLVDEKGNKKIHEIAKISGLGMELRKKITFKNDLDEPVLDKDWYGKVASIDGVCVSSRVRRLRHARLVNWRSDRSSDTCILDEEFLNSLIL